MHAVTRGVCGLTHPTQAQGTHFFSRSGLVQSGRYTTGGCWQGTSELAAGSVDAVLSV